MTCHFVSCAGKKRPKKEKIRSLNDAWKGYLKTWGWWNSQSFQGHCLGPHKGGLQHPYEPPVAMFNMLTHVRLWPRAIKLSSSWKTEVSKSAWIKPWSSATKHYESGSTVSFSIPHCYLELEVTGKRLNCEMFLRDWNSTGASFYGPEKATLVGNVTNKNWGTIKGEHKVFLWEFDCRFSHSQENCPLYRMAARRRYNFAIMLKKKKKVTNYLLHCFYCELVNKNSASFFTSMINVVFKSVDLET